MSDQPTNSTEAQDAEHEALQAVFDRVVSWQESATPEVIREELDRGLAEAGVDVDEATRARLVQYIHEDGSHGRVSDILS